MIKAIILDDEIVFRNKLQTLLLDYGQLEVVLSTSRGEEALSYISEKPVDLVFLDMKMPSMSGIDFLHELSYLNSQIKVIVTSGFADFSYAQSCIKYGVKDYLVKHTINRNTINEALLSVGLQVSSGDDSKALKDNQVRMFLERDQKIQQELFWQMNPDFVIGRLVGLLFVPFELKNRIKDKKRYRRRVAAVIEDTFFGMKRVSVDYAIGTSDQGVVYVLLSFRHSNDQEIEQFLFDVHSKLNVTLKSLLNAGVFLRKTTISSQLGQTLALISQRTLLQEDFFYDSNTAEVRSIRETKSYELREEELAIARRLDFYGKHFSAEMIQELADHLKQLIREKHLQPKVVDEAFQKFVLTLAEGLGVESSFDLDEQDGLERFREKQERFDQLVNGLCQIKTQQGKEHYGELMMRCLEYIHSHFLEDISLEKCSDFLQCSYFSLSRSFKKTVGTPFSKYINQLRVGYAKILLQEGKYKVQEIVEKCGFGNYNYFYRVFKEIEGTAPTVFVKL